MFARGYQPPAADIPATGNRTMHNALVIRNVLRAESRGTSARDIMVSNGLVDAYLRAVDEKGRQHAGYQE